MIHLAKTFSVSDLDNSLLETVVDKTMSTSGPSFADEDHMIWLTAPEQI